MLPQRRDRGTTSPLGTLGRGAGQQPVQHPKKGRSYFWGAGHQASKQAPQGRVGAMTEKPSSLVYLDMAEDAALERGDWASWWRGEGDGLDSPSPPPVGDDAFDINLPMHTPPHANDCTASQCGGNSLWGMSGVSGNSGHRSAEAVGSGREPESPALAPYGARSPSPHPPIGSPSCLPSRRQKAKSGVIDASAVPDPM